MTLTTSTCLLIVIPAGDQDSEPSRLSQPISRLAVIWHGAIVISRNLSREQWSPHALALPVSKRLCIPTIDEPITKITGHTWLKRRTSIAEFDCGTKRYCIHIFKTLPLTGEHYVVLIPRQSPGAMTFAELNVLSRLLSSINSFIARSRRFKSLINMEIKKWLINS
jgi:hypothetical protein